MSKQFAGTRPISEAGAVVSDSFQFPGEIMSSGAPEKTEKNRWSMAARPGELRKLMPIRVDNTGVFSGGSYLFDTWENAQKFVDWVNNDFIVDGYHYFDNPRYLEKTVQIWHIAAAEDFAPVESKQKIMRFQRWHLPEDVSPKQLGEEWWPTLREAAVKDDLSSLWLLVGIDEHDRPELGVLLVSDGDPAEAVNDAYGSEAESIHRLESLESPGEQIAEALNATKLFDRTSWIYNIWSPIEDGDTSLDKVLFPVSPPMPGLSEKND